MIDPTRLYTALLNTGLQQKDNPLYQVIHSLIDNLISISKLSPGLSASPVITQTNIIRQFAATGKYRIPIKINDQYIRVSIKGTGTVTSSSAKING